MSTINLNLPNSLHKQAIELARKDEISIDQFVAQALAEKIAVLMAKDYLDSRAKKGSREKFELALAKVSQREPEEYDKL